MAPPLSVLLLATTAAATANPVALVFYDIEGTLLPPPGSSEAALEGFRSRARSWGGSPFAAHLKRLRSLGVVPAGLPSSDKTTWAHVLRAGGLQEVHPAAGLKPLLGASPGIPEVLGNFGVYGDIRWAASLGGNKTAAIAGLVNRTLYVSRNSFLAHRAVRRGLARHAVWAADGLDAKTMAVVEAMAVDLDRTVRCPHPGGAPMWEDFLCCTHQRCDPSRCCVPPAAPSGGNAGELPRGSVAAAAASEQNIVV